MVKGKGLLWKNIVFFAGALLFCNGLINGVPLNKISKSPERASFVSDLKSTRKDLVELENDMPFKPWSDNDKEFYNGRLIKIEKKRISFENKILNIDSLVEDYKRKMFLYGYLPQEFYKKNLSPNLYKTLFP